MNDYCVIPGDIALSGQWRLLPPDTDPDHTWEWQDIGSDASDDSAPLGDDWENPFRSRVDQGAANALLLALARGARRMPVLTDAEFLLGRAPGDGHRAGLQVLYAAKAGAAGGGSGTAELVIHGEPLAFHPDEEVLQAWREAAEVHMGTESELAVVIEEPEEEPTEDELTEEELTEEDSD